MTSWLAELPRHAAPEQLQLAQVVARHIFSSEWCTDPCRSYLAYLSLRLGASSTFYQACAEHKWYGGWTEDRNEMQTLQRVGAGTRR
jgi:hypothetical protein